MNPFNVLEISPEASAEEIKAAYHRLAKRWHPDRFTGAEKVEAENHFRELAEAFSILKDPAKRLSLQQQMPRTPRGAAAVEPESAQERTPEDWASLAKAAFEEGKLDQARALIYYAIRLDEKKAQYHCLLASILEREGGDLRAVVKALETAVSLAPKDVESHLRLAGHFQTLGLQARSNRHLQIARGISPNHPRLKQFEPKAAAPSRSAGPSKGKGGVPAAPSGLLDQLLDQLKDLWARLTGKG